MKKTVFVVFEKDDTSTGSEEFRCVRNTFEKSAKAAAVIKPAVILEVSTAEDGSAKNIINRWELS